MGSETARETVGFTLDGMEQVMVFVFDPMLVLPEYVVTVNVTETEDPVVFCCAKDSGGVHEMLVVLDFVAIVPEALPHLYVMVWVRLESCLVTVRVIAVPSVPLLAVNDDFRAMVSNVPVPDPVFVPMLDPLNVMENCWLNEYENVFLPLESCAIVVVPLARVFVALFPMPTVFVPLYVLPLTVTDHFFDAEESIRPELPEISSIFQPIVVLLLAMD